MRNFQTLRPNKSKYCYNIHKINSIPALKIIAGLIDLFINAEIRFILIFGLIFEKRQ